MNRQIFSLCLATYFAAANTFLLRASAVEPVYIGTSSCSQFACHGRSSSSPGENWKSAYTVWATRDPHARACDVLYSPRAERMFELLSNTDNNVRESSSETATASDKYLAFLKSRCLGCHATSHPNEQKTSPSGLNENAWSDGVGCESCHGAAGGWVAEHTTSRWSDAERKNLARWGMLDTKSMAGRAAVCIECHVGPRRTTSQDQIAVDHDLIAAGHPRLLFELNTYLSNLPSHWDVSRDIRRHEQAHSPQSFHFDTWRVGQWQTAIQLSDHLADGLSSAAVGKPAAAIDFANFECVACHHKLKPRSIRVDSQSVAAKVPLRLASSPFDGIQILLHSSKDPMLNILSQDVRALSKNV